MACWSFKAFNLNNPTLGYSNDGINWTPVKNSENLFNEVNNILWNGVRWVATGTGNYSFAYSEDGIKLVWYK